MDAGKLISRGAIHMQAVGNRDGQQSMYGLTEEGGIREIIVMQGPLYHRRTLRNPEDDYCQNHIPPMIF